MVVFQDRQGSLNQIPLANIPEVRDTGWRILTGIDADPAPIHLQHPSVISRFILTCGEDVPANTLIIVGKLTPSGPSACDGRLLLRSG